MRVHELAKQLGIESKAVIGWLNEIISLVAAIQWMTKYATLEMEVKDDGILD